MKYVACAVLFAAVAAPGLAQDKYQWLEAPADTRARSWASQQTSMAEARVATMPNHAKIETELKTLLAAAEPPPAFQLFGPVVLRFQRSVAHPHGVLSVGRRVGDGAPGTWRDVLDVDAFRRAEGKPYELRFGALALSCAPPDYNRCLMPLSPDGGDATELREFDLGTGGFVADGFRTPASQSYAAFLDRNRLLIEHTLNGSPTLPTGWPATVSIWQRGTPLKSARIVYQAQPTDSLMFIGATGYGANRVGVISRSINYSTIENIVVRPDGSVETSSIPRQVKMLLSNTGGGRIFAQLTQAATVAGKSLPAETIVAYDTKVSIAPNKRLTAVYLPTGGDFLGDPFTGILPGKNTARFIARNGGTQRIVTATRTAGGWTIANGTVEPVGAAVNFVTGDPAGDAMIVSRSGYLLPERLELTDGVRAPMVLHAEKPTFDASRFVTELKTATSKDGTRIDYFLLRPRDGKRGSVPLLMTGYGAFGIRAVSDQSAS